MQCNDYASAAAWAGQAPAAPAAAGMPQKPAKRPQVPMFWAVPEAHREPCRPCKQGLSRVFTSELI